MAQPHPSILLRNFLESKLRERGLSQLEVARFLGLAPSAVSRILRGTRQVSATELISISNLLHVSLDEMNEAIGSGFEVQKEIGNENTFKGAMENEIVSSAGYFNRIDVSAYDEGGTFSLIEELLAGKKYREGGLRWLRVDDDSMVPTFDPGDFAIVDVYQNLPSYAGVYLVEHGQNAQSLRRLEIESFNTDQSPEAQVLVQAENPKFRTYTVPLDKLVILGRCLLKITGRVT